MQIAQRSQELTLLPAQSGGEALKILEQQSFDVIITDYSMPGMNGIELIRKIRSANDVTPVLLFCDAPDDSVAADALNSGANYFLRKGRDPGRQFRQIQEIVKTLSSQSLSRRSIEISRRVITDLVNFSSDPSFAIDRFGTVIAWNDSIEQLTDLPAQSVLGKADLTYAEPFHGTRKKTLVNLVFAPDEEIRKEQYLLINRVKNGPVIAVTRGVRRDGTPWTLWVKAMPIYDALGNFLAVAGTVRDVTATFGDIIPGEPAPGSPPPLPEKKRQGIPGHNLLRKILNTALTHYKEGVHYAQEKDYQNAIAAFDKAIAIDDTHPFIWNDRGICYRELGDYTQALKSCIRAVELAPESPQCLFTLGETLERIGIMYHSTKYLDSAAQTFRMVINQLPNNADAWSHLGICYQEMGRSDEAKFSLDRARDIRLGGKDTRIRYTRDEYL